MCIDCSLLVKAVIVLYLISHSVFYSILFGVCIIPARAVGKALSACASCLALALALNKTNLDLDLVPSAPSLPTIQSERGLYSCPKMRHRLNTWIMHPWCQSEGSICSSCSTAMADYADTDV